MDKQIEMLYILGTSFSGSTILGFVLGSSNKVFDAGELKLLYRHGKRPMQACSCGAKLRECPVWGKVDISGRQLYHDSTFFKKMKIILSVLVGKKVRMNEFECPHEQALIESIAEHSGDELLYVIDASKSLWRFIHLLKCKNIKLKPVFVQRPIEGTAASFIKHKQSFYKGLFIHKINNFLIQRFLKYTGMEYVLIDYYKLCRDPQQELMQIGDLLGIDYSSTDYVEAIRNRSYHVAYGNPGPRKRFSETFEGLRYDDSWKQRLTPFQKLVVRIIK
jgi:hypothetical protein